MLSRRTQLVLLFIGIGAASFLFLERVRIRDLITAVTKPPLPTAVPYVSPTHTPAPSVATTSTPAPIVAASVNLAVPFVSQAPKMVWDEDHQEFCEEAAALMAASYIHGDLTVKNPDVADARLYAIKDWEMAHFGYFKDTTAAETARILREYLGVAKAQVVANPTEANIKSWLASGRVVLVPAAGRELGNPHFKSPGPIYHMLILKGYTADGKFITNDAGTRFGADYLYAPSVIMNAMHDWNGGDVYNGAKVVIVVG